LTTADNCGIITSCPLEKNVDAEREKAILLIIKFIRNQMMVVNLCEQKNLFAQLEKFPDITLEEVIKYYIEAVWRNA